jgi:hypothetical protein
MSLAAYVKRFASGFHDTPATDTPMDSQFLNAVETALLGLLGAAPTDGQVYVYDDSLGRFKTVLLADAHIAAGAGIAKSKLASLQIADADVAAAANIAASKIAGNLPVSKLNGYPGDSEQLVYGDGRWEKKTIAWDKKTASVSTAGTTFAAGADVLAAALTFTADGVSTYRVRIEADAWGTNTASDGVQARLNLDGADGGFMAIGSLLGANQQLPLNGSLIIAPAAGAHTVNVRLTALVGGTATISGGAGGAGAHAPIVVSIERL